MTRGRIIERKANGRWSIGNGPPIYSSLDSAKLELMQHEKRGLSADDLAQLDELRLELNIQGAIQMSEILNCVNDAKWQAFRVSLKGLSTSEKIRKLRGYKRNNSGRCVDVRVENYLNALRRGGQLPAKRRK